MSEIRIIEKDGHVSIEGKGSANMLLNLLSIAVSSIVAQSSLDTEAPFETMEEELCVFNGVMTERSIREIGRIAKLDKEYIDSLVDQYFNAEDYEAGYKDLLSEPAYNFQKTDTEPSMPKPEGFNIPPNYPSNDDPVSNILRFVERAKADTKANRYEN